VFYNPLLDHIAPPERQGFISGLGQAGNWIGQLVGILIALPFAIGAIYLFGAHGRAQAFLPATIIFLLLSLPMLIGFKKSRTQKAEGIPKTTLKDSKNLSSFPESARFFSPISFSMMLL
jgi:MFS-type transporter involved in bile tolerance (Atg22 family)